MYAHAMHVYIKKDHVISNVLEEVDRLIVRRPSISIIPSRALSTSLTLIITRSIIS